MIGHSEIVSGNVQIPPNHPEGIPVATSTSQLEEAHGQRFPSGDALLWPAQDTGPPNNNAPQPELTSSLLWPDSENLWKIYHKGALKP